MFFLYIILFFTQQIQCEGFIPGNLIKTKTGLIRIGSINVGDDIFCFNTCKNEFTIEKVTSRKLTYTNEIVKITLSRNDQKSFACCEEYLPIYSSSKQRFLAPLRINSSNQYWVLAENLKPGEYLLKYAEQNCTEKKFSFIKIEKVEKFIMKEPAPLISLSVKNNKNYCVSPHEILVHNFLPELSMVEFGLLEASAAAESAALDLVALGSAASGIALPVAGVLATGYLATKLYNNYYNNYEKMDANLGQNSLPGADANILPALDSINSIDFCKTQNQSKLALDFESKIFSCCPPANFSGENQSSRSKRHSLARIHENQFKQMSFENKIREFERRQWHQICTFENFRIRQILFDFRQPGIINNYLLVRDHSDLTKDGQTASPGILSIDLLTKEYDEVKVKKSENGLMIDWRDYNIPGNIFAFSTSSANIQNLSIWVYCQGSCKYLDRNKIFEPVWLLVNNQGKIIEGMSQKRKPESVSVAYNTPAVIFFRKNESWPTKNGGTLIYDPSRPDGVLFERDANGELLTKYDKNGKCLFSKELEAQKVKAMEALKKAEEIVVAAEREYEKTIEDFENQVKNLVAQIKEAKEKETKDNIAKKDDQPQQENSQITVGSSPSPGDPGNEEEEDEDDEEEDEKNVHGIDVEGPHNPLTRKDYKDFNIKLPKDS